MIEPQATGPVSAPGVSIVVPVWGPYSGAPLTQALESLRAQDLKARIVVVDNASEPPLPAVPDAVTVRSATRLSVGRARNLGLERVDTPYVVFWDADDVMLPGTLRRLADRIVAEPGAAAVAAAILEGEPPLRHRWPRPWMAGMARRQRMFALAHSVWSMFPTTGSTIMRTSAVRSAGGYGDADSGEDWVLGVSLAFRGELVLDPVPGRLYRRHPASLWASRRSARHLVGHAAAVRARIRQDPAIPAWVRPLLPLVAVAQLVAALVVHPAARALRALRRRAPLAR
jgi:glycosyltransferase involved in cell wall biosynthesis